MENFVNIIKEFRSQVGKSEGDSKALDTVPQVIKAADVEAFVISEAKLIGKLGDANRHALLTENLEGITRQATAIVEQKESVVEDDTFAVLVMSPERPNADLDSNIGVVLKAVEDFRKAFDSFIDERKVEKATLERCMAEKTAEQIDACETDLLSIKKQAENGTLNPEGIRKIWNAPPKEALDSSLALLAKVDALKQAINEVTPAISEIAKRDVKTEAAPAHEDAPSPEADQNKDKSNDKEVAPPKVAKSVNSDGGEDDSFNWDTDLNMLHKTEKSAGSKVNGDLREAYREMTHQPAPDDDPSVAMYRHMVSVGAEDF